MFRWVVLGGGVLDKDFEDFAEASSFGLRHDDSWAPDPFYETF
jgi:hypothetical protein